MADSNLEESEIFEYLEHLIDNADSLLEEAKILKSHGKMKRATFLLITSLEEVIKLYMYVTSGFTKKNLHFHKEKFKPLQDSIKDALNSESINKAFLDVKASLSEEQKAKADYVMDMFKKIFLGMFDFGLIRKHLLYIDPPNQRIVPLVDYSASIWLMAESLELFIKTYKEKIAKYKV